MADVRRILLWYRNDLRLHDSEPLYRAVKAKAQILPLYCCDPRQFGQTTFGFAKTGPFRAQFLRESILDLRQAWRSRGSNLVVRVGQPELLVPELVKTWAIDAVYFHKEVTSEETSVEATLTAALAELGTEVRAFWGATLHHPDDLPFAIADVPEVFTQYRKKVEKKATVNPPLPVPKQLPALPADCDPGEIPTLQELGVAAPTESDRGVLAFKGGETAGKARLMEYFWERDRLRVYKETRNGMLGADYSSKFSAWLAHGCLSSRLIYAQVQKYETERVRNDSTYWLIFELLWRDYFRFIGAKHGDRVFLRAGLQGIELPWQQDWERFDLWRSGKTGYPLVDANMRELAETGFMSNRGRQNVASFLTKNLGIDWRMGAEWFESLLIDYDACSNWGNWNYTAGVGNDARGFRYFNIPKQSQTYDPDGDYLRHWLPELASIPGKKIHDVWKLSQGEQKQFGVTLGVDYPKPVVDFIKSVSHNEKAYEAAIAAASNSARAMGA